MWNPRTGNTITIAEGGNHLSLALPLVYLSGIGISAWTKPFDDCILDEFVMVKLWITDSNPFRNNPY